MWPDPRSPPCVELFDQIQGPLFGIHDLVSDSTRSQASIRTRRTDPRQNGYQPGLSPSNCSKGSPSEDSQTRTGSPKKPQRGKGIHAANINVDSVGRSLSANGATKKLQLCFLATEPRSQCLNRAKSRDPNGPSTASLVHPS